MPQIGEREQLLSSEEIRMFFFNGKTHKNTFLVHLPTDQSVDISGAQYLHPGFSRCRMYWWAQLSCWCLRKHSRLSRTLWSTPGRWLTGGVGYHGFWRQDVKDVKVSMLGEI